MKEMKEVTDFSKYKEGDYFGLFKNNRWTIAVLWQFQNHIVYGGEYGLVKTEDKLVILKNIFSKQESFIPDYNANLVLNSIINWDVAKIGIIANNKTRGWQPYFDKCHYIENEDDYNFVLKNMLIDNL